MPKLMFLLLLSREFGCAHSELCQQKKCMTQSIMICLLLLMNLYHGMLVPQ
uniref:NS9 n=1 Tax=Alphacoronavirus UKMa1 TaxID=2520503 RepID=A0A481S0C4_9ALPC|nr:NS9 [Alphacoronavirus UKMa1]